MPDYPGAAERPYAAIWQGRIKPLAGKHGVISVHTRPELAKRSALRQRDALYPMWGAYQPWFFYQVIDRRSGEVVTAIF